MRRLLAFLVAAIPLTARAEPPAEPAPAEPASTEPALPDPSPVAGEPLATRLPDPPPPPQPPAFDPDAPPPGGWRLMLSDLTIARVNPLGLETRIRFGLQKRLYRSEKVISKTNFGFVGLYPKLNPASAQLGVGGELQPVSMFNLRAVAEVQQFFGTFGFLQSFSSADAIYSDHTLKALRDDPARAPQKAALFHASVQPMLMLRVGPIALRALALLDYWDFDVRAGDTTAYEATFDTLLPDRGWTISTDTDLLYTGKKQLAIGLRHSSVTPLYRAEHFADDARFTAYDGDNAHHRLGLFAAYTFSDRGPSRFNKPTLIVIASWYLDHRFRTGAPTTLPAGAVADDYTSRAFPYVLVGFAFESDLRRVAP